MHVQRMGVCEYSENGGLSGCTEHGNLWVCAMMRIFKTFLKLQCPRNNQFSLQLDLYFLFYLGTRSCPGEEYWDREHADP